MPAETTAAPLTVSAIVAGIFGLITSLSAVQITGGLSVATVVGGVIYAFVATRRELSNEEIEQRLEVLGIRAEVTGIARREGNEQRRREREHDA